MPISISERCHRALARLLLTAALAGCASADIAATPTAAGASEAPIAWKAVLVAADGSQHVFDNGRRRFARWLAARGVPEANIRHLSAAEAGREPGVRPATAGDLKAALQGLAPGPGSGCLVFLTSHGAPNRGIAMGRGALTAAALQEILDSECTSLPTVAIVSACYSGQFITPGTRKDNRVILTAAASDRPSFGCSNDFEFSYYDECLLDALEVATLWFEASRAAAVCVAGKERARGERPSNPQAYFGRGLGNLALPGVRPGG